LGIAVGSLLGGVAMQKGRRCLIIFSNFVCIGIALASMI